jgi:hypothetical protein
MISVSKAEGEPTELQCTAEWPPDSIEAIQLGERFMSSRIFKRSARAFRAPRIARQRVRPLPKYPRIPNRDRVAKISSNEASEATRLGGDLNPLLGFYFPLFSMAFPWGISIRVVTCGK